MNILQELFYYTTRSKVVTTRGDEVEIKKHRGWEYVNYGGRKIGLSKITKIKSSDEKDDYVSDYIFGGLFIDFPCPAMDFWIYRHRLGNKITASKYKEKFKIHERKAA